MWTTPLKDILSLANFRCAPITAATLFLILFRNRWLLLLCDTLRIRYRLLWFSCRYRGNNRYSCRLSLFFFLFLFLLFFFRFRFRLTLTFLSNRYIFGLLWLLLNNFRLFYWCWLRFYSHTFILHLDIVTFFLFDRGNYLLLTLIDLVLKQYFGLLIQLLQAVVHTLLKSSE